MAGDGFLATPGVPVQPLPEFGEFVAARSPRLLRVAYLLTRDWALAEDLLQTSLAKAWSAWKRIETDPEAYVRRILVTTYSSWWRRPWLHERPAAQLPDAAGADAHRAVDERDEMWQALGRLPNRQRAVLVLRYYEDLSEAEIAETLGIAPGTVKSLAVAGLVNLRLDALFRDEPGAHHVRLAAVAERVKMRRRRAIAVVGAACAVVIAIIIGYAVSPALRSSPHPNPLTTPDPLVTASPRNVGGLPEYFFGGRVTQTVTLTADHPRDQITWTPPEAGGLYLFRCGRVPPKVEVHYSVTSDGDKVDHRCSATLTDVVLCQEVRPGTKMSTPVIALEYAEGPDDKRVPIPADFLVTVGVADNVDWSEYVFPPKPSTIDPLAAMDSGNTTKITSDPADPMAPRTVRIRRPHNLLVLADGTGPTRLYLAIDGVELLDFKKWSYEPVKISQGFWLGFKGAGSVVTLTITPRYATGPWTVELADRCDLDYCPTLTPDGDSTAVSAK
jgi:RNA polymerase sigma-70 factor (sigma-E family)